jgi:hypothetical protein
MTREAAEEKVREYKKLETTIIINAATGARMLVVSIYPFKLPNGDSYTVMCNLQGDAGKLIEELDYVLTKYII